MGRSVRNPKIHLSADMILGLLDELQDDQSEVVRDFLAVLQEHPVAVRERVPTSVLPLLRSPESESPELTGSLDRELTPLSPISESTDDLESASEDVSEHVECATRKGRNGDGSSGNNCCRNGVKRVSLVAHSTRRSKRLRRGNRTDVESDSEDVDAAPDDEDVLIGSVLDDADNIRSDGEEEMCKTNGRVTSGRGKRRVVSAGGPKDKGALKDTVVANELQKKQADRNRKAKSKGARKRAKKSAEEGGLRWSTDGAPPTLTQGTHDFIIKLCGIISNTGLQSLVDLILLLIQPGETACDRLQDDRHPLSLGGIIASCAEAQSRLALADFHHMISLIRLAFHFDRGVFVFRCI
jgi:hypothetical protein